MPWQEYIPALGAGGETRFRELVEAEWRKYPALSPHDNRSYDGRRSRVTQLMLSIGRKEGGIPAVIAIMTRDLSSAYRFWEIAKLYLEIDEPETALEWAETGASYFTDRPDSRLMDFLIERYTAGGDYAKAYAILWDRFTRNPGLAAYKELHAYAQAWGDWELWWEKAWQHLRETMVQEKNVKPSPREWRTARPDSSEAVRILLWENRSEEAWQEATAGGCSAKYG